MKINEMYLLMQNEFCVFVDLRSKCEPFHIFKRFLKLCFLDFFGFFFIPLCNGLQKLILISLNSIVFVKERTKGRFWIFDRFFIKNLTFNLHQIFLFFF